jgi:hypothetical protein
MPIVLLTAICVLSGDHPTTEPQPSASIHKWAIALNLWGFAAVMTGKFDGTWVRSVGVGNSENPTAY